MSKDTDRCHACTDQTPSDGSQQAAFRDLHRAMHDVGRGMSVGMLRLAREVNASIERNRVAR